MNELSQEEALTLLEAIGWDLGHMPRQSEEYTRFYESTDKFLWSAFLKLRNIAYPLVPYTEAPSADPQQP